MTAAAATSGSFCACPAIRAATALPDGRNAPSSQAEPGDRASRTSGSGGRTVDLLLARGEH